MNTITQSDIDRINELHRGIKRASVRVLKDALEIGNFFLEVHDEKGIRRGGNMKKKSQDGTWADWLEVNFPDIGVTSVFQYMRIARYEGLLPANYTGVVRFGIHEALRVIRFHERLHAH